MPIRKCIGQTTAPDPINTERLGERKERILVTTLVKPLTVLRFLTSKLVYTGKEFTAVDCIACFEAFEKVVLGMDRDRQYRNKYGPEVFLFRALYQNLDKLSKINPRERYQVLSTQYSFYRGKFASRGFYFAVEGQALSLYQTKLKNRFPTIFPPKPFVGIGYGDHGTAKDIALDGSPKWQEVASDDSLRKETEYWGSKSDPFKQYTIHPQQRPEHLFKGVSSTNR